MQPTSLNDLPANFTLSQISMKDVINKAGQPETQGIPMEKILKAVANLSEANQEISKEAGTMPRPIITIQGEESVS